eukprot:3939079-Rhodomonas_salina.1
MSAGRGQTSERDHTHRDLPQQSETIGPGRGKLGRGKGGDRLNAEHDEDDDRVGDERHVGAAAVVDEDWTKDAGAHVRGDRST